MTQIGVTSTSAVVEPGTAATTTTRFPRFRDGAAFEAHGTDGRRRSFWWVLCGYWSKTERRKTLAITVTESMVDYYISDLRLQASTPSNHMWFTFLFAAPPQFLYQAPPGAQQLTRPDFANVPHFGHVIAPRIVELMGVRTISSRSGNGRRVT